MEEFEDIFGDDAFSVSGLTAGASELPDVPAPLLNSGLGKVDRINSETAHIETEGRSLKLISSSQRGEPAQQNNRRSRKVVSIRTERRAQEDRVTASELAFLRTLGTRKEKIASAQVEVLHRMADMRENGIATKEHIFLGAIQGLQIDADGSVIDDFYDRFKLTKTPDMALDFSGDGDSLRAQIKGKLRSVKKLVKGLNAQRYVAYCGPEFFDKLADCDEIRSTYLQTQAARELRSEIPNEFNFAGVTWKEYEPDSDDECKINDDECRFVPNYRGAIQMVYSPGEAIEHIGTRGQEEYWDLVPDRDRHRHIDLELSFYPLFYPQLPQAFFTGKIK